MIVTFAMKVTPAPAVLAQEIDDEFVLLHTEREQYFALNAAGGRMWRLLGDAASIQEVYDALLAEYDVSPQQLQDDLQNFVTELAEHGLVEVHRD
jgi:hypothetical protein